MVANARAAGLYGKLPAFGDFVTRRLTPGFVEPWDQWLQECIAGSRALMGNAWLERYLEAPVWRFLLSSGVLADQAYAGVLVPSVDRVGRYFPLTLAMEIGIDTDPTDTFAASRDWFRALEDIGLDALATPLNLDALDARLAATPLPPLAIGDLGLDDTVPIKAGAARHLGMRLPEGLGDDTTAWRAMVARVRKPVSLWATGSNDVCDRVYLAAEGLPAANPFCAMLNGDWERHGWSMTDTAQAG